MAANTSQQQYLWNEVCVVQEKPAKEHDTPSILSVLANIIFALVQRQKKKKKQNKVVYMAKDSGMEKNWPLTKLWMFTPLVIAFSHL